VVLLKIMTFVLESSKADKRKGKLCGEDLLFPSEATFKGLKLGSLSI